MELEMWGMTNVTKSGTSVELPSTVEPDRNFQALRSAANNEAMQRIICRQTSCWISWSGV
jgi:hypothetical protein